MRLVADPRPRRVRRSPATFAAILAGLLALPLGVAVARGDDEGPWRHLGFRALGPATGGRATDVVGVPGKPDCYLATAASGVWASHDGGLHWEPIFDDQPVSSIGSIAVAASDPNVLYVGTGESFVRGNVAEGNGLYRSTDAGASFENVWEAEGQIAAIAIDPRDADVVFAAALGSPFGPTKERGLLRTRDGGEHFETVLFVDQDSGACDVCIDPNNPRIVFAATWQVRRTPWDLRSGGPGSGLYRSKDGGSTFTRLEGEGLPEGDWGRIGVRVAPSDSRRVYALIEAEEGGLFRSDDGGESFELVNDHRALRQRAWYYSQLTVEPNDADTVWFPEVWTLRTLDGGKTLESVEVGGWDHHRMWIDPVNPARRLGASDAGVALSFDGGASWTRPALPCAQLYRLTTDTRSPYHVLASVQDLGTVSAPSDTLRSDGVLLSDWTPVGGGEAGWVAVTADDPDVVYAGEYLGFVSRFDARTGRAPHVGVYTDDSSGRGPADLPYRFQWTAPILTSKHDPDVVYHAGNVLLRSEDGGQHWTAVSPDLTRNDRTKQGWAGGPITGDNTGVEYYCTIYALAESPHDGQVLWAGSDDGLVHVTQDGGAHWTAVTPPGMPEWATVTSIEVSPHEPGSAYLVADAHRLDDEAPYAWKTEDFGATWRSLTRDLDPEISLHVLREDPVQPGLLYLGTERGLLVSFDDGLSFEDLSLDLPTVSVVDLALPEDDLVVGTLGRGIYVLDDLAPIRECTPKVRAAAVSLLKVAPTTAWHSGPGSYGSSEGSAQNPPRGMVFHYSLAESTDDEVVAEILDADGNLVRRLSSTADELPFPEGDLELDPDAEPEAALSQEDGIHRGVWDLRHDGATRLFDARLDAGSPETGPLAVPGEYRLRLTAAGRTLEQPFTVLPDPRETYDPEALRAQRDFLLAGRDATTKIAQAVEQIRSLRGQLEARIELLPDAPDLSELRDACKALAASLTGIERQLHNPDASVSYDILAGRFGGAKLLSRWGWLLSSSDAHRGPPTQGMQETFDKLAAETDRQLSELDSLLEGGVADLEECARRHGIGFVLVPDRDEL